MRPALSLVLLWACVPPPSQPSYFAQQGQAPSYGEPPSGSTAAPPAGAADAPAPSVTVEAATAAAPPAQTTSALTITPPAGFTQNQGWWMSRREEPGYGYTTIWAGVARAMPSTAPASDAGATLRSLWQAYMPAEAKNEAAGMVYRRLLGDGLVAYYLHGNGVVNGDAPIGHWYTLYLVDCGTTWEPLIAGGLYQRTGPSVAFDMAVGQGMSDALDSVEPLLATVRCAGPRNSAIVSPEQVAGMYYFGSGASQAYVNIYTGATSSYNLSYAGSYDLRSDGSVEYRYSSASGFDAGVNFQGEKSGGRWTVSGDMLVLELVDLRRTRRYRIASLTTFPQEKVLILLDEDKSAAPTHVTRGTFLTTQKK